jgi:hypothetical protein
MDRGSWWLAVQTDKHNHGNTEQNENTEKTDKLTSALAG